MSFVRIEMLGTAQRHHFECKVCDAKAILPVGHAAA
jgi:hypothetical protein